jgi:hypothetical protein
MDEEEYICPQGWRWSSIYDALHRAYKDSRSSAVAVAVADDDDDASAEEEEAAETLEITEPPHLLPPNASDVARKHRWEETVQWAEANGFSHLIPELPEDERYYHATYN